MGNENNTPQDRSGQRQEDGRGGRSSRRHRRSQRGRKHRSEQQPHDNARAQQAAVHEPEEVQNGKFSKANMIVLVDEDAAYVEMESLAVVNYVSGYNPMGFTALDKALSYITSPRNESRIRMVMLNLETSSQAGASIEGLLAALRKHGDIPLVAISQHNSAENVNRVVSLGAVGFLTKAFTMDVFVRFVKDVLRKGGVSGWQCTQCGKLVPMDQVDLLNMRPIKCAHHDCVSSDIREIHFGAATPVEKAG